MSNVAEIEAAVMELPLQDAQKIAQWLQKYLEQQSDTEPTKSAQMPVKLPDYARRRRMIFGDKVLANMVLLGREQERW